MSTTSGKGYRHALAAARTAMWCARGLNLKPETLTALGTFFYNTFDEGDLEDAQRR